MTLADLVLKGGTVALLVLGALFDVRYQRIPNALTFGGAVVGLAANFAFRQPTGGLLSFEGWIVGAVLLAVPFAMRGVGGGDVKLLAAAGAWGGPDFVFATALFGAVIGAVVALILLIANRRLGDTLRPFIRWGRLELALLLSAVTPHPPRWALGSESISVTSPVAAEKLRFAYGPALAIGGIAALVIR